MTRRRGLGTALCVLVLGTTAACASPRTSSGDLATAGSGDPTFNRSNRTYRIEGAMTSLRIDAEVASVDLTAVDGAGTTSVTEDLEGEATTDEQMQGTTAVLRARCPGGIVVGRSCTVRYHITLPVTVGVDVEGAAGAVTMRGPLREATINATAGAITGTALGAGTYRVTTTAGRVDLSFAAAPPLVQVRTDAGAVRIVLPGAVTYAVTGDTTLGSRDVSVDRDPSSAHRVDVSTVVGAVTVAKG